MRFRHRVLIIGVAAAITLGNLLATESRLSWSTYSGTTSTPSSVAAAASFCAAPSTVWMTGMEPGMLSTTSGTGMFDGQNTAGGAPSVDGYITHTGDYSLHINKSAAGASYTSVNVSTSVVVRRFAIRLNALPAADVARFTRDSPVAGAGAEFGYLKASNKFRIEFDGVTSAVSSMTVAAGKWYVIDTRTNYGTNPRTMDWRIDGVAQTSISTAAAATTSDILRWGSSNTTVDVFDAYYDDMVVSYTAADYPLPSGGIRALTPNSYVTKSDAGNVIKNSSNAAVGSGDETRLDEIPMTASNDYVKMTGTGATSYAEFGFDDVTRSGCVNGVRAVAALHASLTSANAAKTSIFEAGAETVVNTSSIPNTSLVYRAKMVSPATGGWDTTKLSGATARVGYATDVTSVPYWDALMLEYDQEPEASTVYPNLLALDAPSGYWRLNETSGATATATTGTPNGTYNGTWYKGIGGATGDGDYAAYPFGNNGDNISLGDNYDFTNKTNFTVEAWVRPLVTNVNWRNPVVTKSNGNDGWQLALADNTNDYGAGTVHDAAVFQRSVGGVSTTAKTTWSLSPGVWYHLVATYDGTNIRLYVNGNLEATTADANNLANTATALKFDEDGWSSPSTSNNYIDDVAIYSGTALNQTRIQTHYNAGIR